jgi:hypothetical protein
MFCTVLPEKDQFLQRDLNRQHYQSGLTGHRFGYFNPKTDRCDRVVDVVMEQFFSTFLGSNHQQGRFGG